MDALKATEALGAAGATHPRVRLADIEGAIAHRFDTTARDAVIEFGGDHAMLDDLGRYSLCILVMKNGFIITGVSAPASPENFDREKGKQFAYENAVRQLWPLMGFALRDRLAEKAAQVESRGEYLGLSR